MTVTVYARHGTKCSKSRERNAGQYKRCKCPLWLRWGKHDKKSARTRSRDIATKAARKFEQELELKANGIEPPKKPDYISVEPENADRLVENLQKATEEIFRDQSGFISANVHVSRDRRKVVNYAQWRSKEDYAAMSKLPGIQAHMKAAAALATGFDPVDYDLRAAMLGEGE